MRAVALVVLLGAATFASAQPRAVDLYIGYSVGGGYDIYARLLVGRPFLAPPGVAPARLAALRKAFMATMQDPAFLAEADRAFFRHVLGFKSVDAGSTTKLQLPGGGEVGLYQAKHPAALHLE